MLFFSRRNSFNFNFMNGVGGEGQGRLSQILFGLCSVDFWLLLTLRNVGPLRSGVFLKQVCWQHFRPNVGLRHWIFWQENWKLFFQEQNYYIAFDDFYMVADMPEVFKKKSFLLQLCNEPRSKASVHQIKSFKYTLRSCQSYRSKLTSDLKWKFIYKKYLNNFIEVYW